MKPDERLSRVFTNLRRFGRLPRVELQSEHPRTLAVVGYGPSLKRTWELVKKCDAVLTVSGAHDFLLERGVIPNFHCELDPREHRVAFVRNAHPKVQYFIASHCHPKMFAALRKFRVSMFHTYTDDDTQRQAQLLGQFDAHNPKVLVLPERKTVGIGSLHIGRGLGYMNFEAHGIDCCYEGEEMWAGPHPGERHTVTRVQVEGREFLTSELMKDQTDEFLKTLSVMPGCRFVVHGGGLLEKRLEIFNRNPKKALEEQWYESEDGGTVLLGV